MHMYNGRIRLTKLRPRVRSIYPLSPSVLRFTKPPARNQRPRALPTVQILAHLKDHGQLQLTPTLKFPRLALTKCHFSNSKNSKAKGKTKLLAKRWWYLSEFDLTTKFIFVFVCLFIKNNYLFLLYFFAFSSNLKVDFHCRVILTCVVRKIYVRK